MGPYQIKIETLVLGGLDYRIRSLLDANQFDDPDGEAAARGIGEGNWSYFGQVWAAGLQLAESMSGFDLAGKRTIEIGCGLALAGLVSHRRHADVTVSDRHPLVEAFLRANLRLNALPPLPYVDLDWTHPPRALGQFDLLLASDVLYEAGHPLELAHFLEAHLAPGGEAIIVDPGRRRHAELSRHLGALGMSCVEERPGGAVRVLHYRFDGPSRPGPGALTPGASPRARWPAPTPAR